MEHTIEYFETMEPMKYYNNEDDTNQKRIDMLENKDDSYIATEKHDGNWGLFIHYSRGHNLIRSRSISKVTGKYGDYTEKLPHLVEEMDKYWPDNTVILGEIWWGSYDTNANTVGTILRCLPQKAIERQKEHKLVVSMFDILMFDGQDLTNMPYESRLLDFLDNTLTPLYFSTTTVFTDNFEAAADSIINNGGEGCVIQLKSNPYLAGTRTAWKTLKLKQTLPHMDLQVVDVIEPNKIYEGDFAENWPYKLDDGQLVTKPYYYHWKNGIRVRLPSGIITDVTSGLTDTDREWLASPEAAKMIAAGELWAEVKAMSINDKGALRHGSLVRLRLLEDGVNS